MLDGNKASLAMVVLLKIFIYGGTAMANGKKIANIYWNTTNSIFHFDNEEHIFVVRILDSVDFICPKYQYGFPKERIEFSYIYLVDRESYEKCIVDTTTAQMVGFCVHPYKDNIITVVFRSFTPSPNMLQFQPNRSYYVISTSDGSPEGLKNDRHGLCYNYNMRLQFYVRPQCRPKKPERYGRRPHIRDRSSGHEDDDSSQDYEDCDENDITSVKDKQTYGPVLVVPKTQTLPVDVVPTNARRPYQWPNDQPLASFSGDARRPPRLPQNGALMNAARLCQLSYWIIFLVLAYVRGMVFRRIV